jgi:hypothetical protein
MTLAFRICDGQSRQVESDVPFETTAHDSALGDYGGVHFGAAVNFLAGLYGLTNTAQSLLWHLNNGNKVVFQGHTITLPLMWRRNAWAKDKVLRLGRAVIWQPPLPLLVDPEDMTIAAGNISPGVPGAGDDQVTANAAAFHWQTNIVNSYHEQGAYASPEILYGKTMTFYCFDRDDGPIHGACFICKATGTNWDIVFAAGQTEPHAIQKYMLEAKDVLKSIQ